MDKKTSVEGREFTLKHWTVGQRFELTGLRDKQDEYYIKALSWGTGLKEDQILELDGDVADELYVQLIEFNKPPLERLQRLQTPSTPETARP